MLVSGNHACTPVGFSRTSDGAPHPDGALKNAARPKILHFRRLCADRPDAIVFMPLAVSTSGRLYHECIRLLSLHAHREAAALASEI
jgi:hypothetical protein